MTKTVLEIRKDFPYLNEEKVGKKVIYLDNAATSQKPQAVIDTITNYYSYQNGSPHRGSHYLSMSATEIYEGTRKKVKNFLNAKRTTEIIFTKNASEALNLVAYAYGLKNLQKDDEIMLSIMEHHSNLCTWQFLTEKTGTKLNYIYLDEDFQLDMKSFEEKISDKVKLVCITCASNVVATIPDVKKIVEIAHKNGAKVLLDASQIVAHKKLDVQELDADFLVFSGHKMLSAMGVGVLYGKFEVLKEMNPFLFGGDMIEYVYEDYSTYLLPAGRFEAGTQNVGAVASLGTAIDYLEEIGFENIEKIEKELMDFAFEEMKKLDFVKTYTTTKENRCPVIAFNVKGAHPHDVSSILDSFGIAIRSGHHCAEPLHRYLKENATCRVSFSFYNTREEVEYFIEKLKEVRRILHLGH
ncbi:SufS family cysteine desulfurase [uncultured Parvimonas sp.]|uniref:aminotransferase class V-fold PLP-dependent enzyme n=1 Tax=uncultured Parvimonas sp. TaxID=747372 RepID=UPI0028054AD9|nr:SufS family cysteine desulfurase [uncultured Parvimonas sp.]